MALTSFVQTNFLGGEISQVAQGRMERPDYRISLNVCLNAILLESGAWARRPGTQLVAPTRGGKAGRLISFAFQENYPYLMEFTDGYLRFTTGPNLVMTNDSQTVTAISAANPAEVTTSSAHGWSTGNSGAFASLGVNNPLLQNRQFTITVTSPTKFTIADALTGTAINGATLGAFVSGTFSRILEIATVYTTSAWSNLRSIQAERQTVLVNGSQAPQNLQVATSPLPGQFATFTLSAFNFLDGPYLDPIPGSLITPNKTNGLVTLTLSFTAYDSARAYNVGDYVTSAGSGYKSLVANNVGNTPATSPASWVAVNAGAPVGANGFVRSDIGRLVRLFSEPPIYSATSTYVAKDVVSYPSTVGANFPSVQAYSYWTATGAIAAGVYPGSSTSWVLTPAIAQWTWGRITDVSGAGQVANDTAVGLLTLGGGLAGAFNGTVNQTWANSAAQSSSLTAYFAFVAATSYNVNDVVSFNGAFYRCGVFFTEWNPTAGYTLADRVEFGGFYWAPIIANQNKQPQLGSPYWTSLGAANPINTAIWTLAGTLTNALFDYYIGQHYTGAAVAVASVTVFPTTDFGFADTVNLITLNLRGKATAPASASDGTLLGTVTLLNQATSVSIASTDTTSTWHYVWVEIVAFYQQPLVPNSGVNGIFTTHIGVAQLLVYSPNVANGSVITAQIAGLPLLYNATIRTWRLGVYSDTSGWPTCGVYHEGRLWLAGSVGNRIDASTTDSIYDFSPTSDYGVVSDNNGISYTFDAEDVNTIFWMAQDQQGIACGTQAGEWLVQASALNNPLTPTSIQAHRVTKIGCANVEPRRAEHTLLFIQKFGRKIVEYFADVFSGKFTAPNLSERAKHLTVSGIQELAYQQELAPIAWSRRADGTLVGATYKRDTLMTSQGPTIVAWHKHALGSGRTVESLCVGPSLDGNLDTVSMITNDPTTGIRHIELMTDLLDEGFVLTDCKLLDDHILPSSTSIDLTTSVSAPYGSLTVNGLWPHNGKTVSAFIAGLDCGDYTVTSGSISVPFGDGVSAGTGSGLFTAALVNSYTTLPIVVGFTYNSDGQLVRPVTPADTGAQAGPGFAKKRRYHYLSAQLYGCVNGSISFGTDFSTLDPIVLRTQDDVAYPVTTLFSGIWRDQCSDDYGYDGMIAWRVSRPLPAIVTAVGGFGSAQDA